jgi:tetratricopeptide (TPR) repeat protein
LLLIFAGLGLLYPLQRWIDAGVPPQPVSDEGLYFNSGETIKKMSVGLDALVADVYWIRTVQYFGRKVIDSGHPLSSAAASGIRMDLLGPLLNIVVTLDPHRIPAYRFGAVFLPEQDPQLAIDLLDRGIRYNPDQWRLYQDLGFIYWHQGAYDKAAEVYEQGSRIAGAPFWMQDLVGLMRIKGGSRDTARQVYLRYLESEDRNVRTQAVARLNQIEALDEMDLINALLGRYKSEAGSCPSNLRPLASILAARGFRLGEDLAPLDPAGYPYVLDGEHCRVELSANSPVLR